MQHYLEQDIQFLAGVGPKRAQLLRNELQIGTFGELLHYYPFRYIDRSRFFQLNELTESSPWVQVRGHVTAMQKAGDGRKERLILTFSDPTGSVKVLFFKGIAYWVKRFRAGVDYTLFGKPSVFNGELHFVHPEIEETAKSEIGIRAFFYDVSATTEKMKTHFLTTRALSRLQSSLWQEMPAKIAETLPERLISRFRLLSRHEALFNLHFPQSADTLKQAEYRIKLEECLFMQLDILHRKQRRKETVAGPVFPTVGKHFHHFFSNCLPFNLTDAQKRVIKEIRKDTATGKQMNRLLQGDVGSGKTLVALMCMLIAADNGYQSCLMAPTEILAMQHFQTLQAFLKGTEVKVALLTGSTPKKARDEIHSALREGKLHILTGTHALLEDAVQFHRLGLAVIDEQHRFGVAQRARLHYKEEIPPHVLVMTATPIPRTLAMTVYGDLDVSVIDQLPAGRKPIQTTHMFDSARLRMHGILREEIARGHQVYVVFPLIEESEKMDYKDLYLGFNTMLESFPPPKYKMGVVHGRLKPEEKAWEMGRFISRETQIMLATTVIEVGVDVPNATVMVIENAERFGLSQLHQLRGRVGRGSDQSFCILMTPNQLSSDARKRIETMVNSSNGFEIAEVDMALRGPGDIEGTRQSGLAMELNLANLAKDQSILQYARTIAEELLADDPGLRKPENSCLLTQLLENKRTSVNWRMIG